MIHLQVDRTRVGGDIQLRLDVDEVRLFHVTTADIERRWVTNLPQKKLVGQKRDVYIQISTQRIYKKK